MKTKKWEILRKVKSKNEKGKIEDVVKIILENRGLTTKKDIDTFLHADLSSVNPKIVGMDSKQLTKALKRITKAIQNKEQIVVYGDYDVDGITGTAILWETLYGLGAHVVPYIPHRVDEGYGLSTKGISSITSQTPNVKLIITVDNGIVANEAVDFAKKQGIDVIITDHHTIGEKLPDAYAIVHTTKLCGAGVGYLFSRELCPVILNDSEGSQSIEKDSSAKPQNDKKSKVPDDHLALVALATVADLVPLTGANRVLLRFGLAQLRNTMRPGLVALFQEAQIEKETIGVYEIGHMIAPRLNAMGRLESAMDSLRLLCTKDRLKANVLADTLNRTNRERQLRTQSAALHAIEHFRLTSAEKKLLFIAHDEYEEGIIGLVAGKLVEEYYLPAIVLSKGEEISKASARSISGFNIIEFIRSSSELLINAGGHPMAAGFTIETSKIQLLQEMLEKLAEEMVDGEMLERVLRIDCQLPLAMVSPALYMKLQELAPFGMGNPEPTFASSVEITEIKTVGKDKNHLKLKVTPKRSANTHQPIAMLDAIGFGLGQKADTLKVGDTIDIAYTISENVWNGRVSLQLKVKDIK